MPPRRSPTPPSRARRARPTAASSSPARPANDPVAQLAAIESAGGDGTVRVARGRELEVSGLTKVFFPDDGITKGAVMRYYAAMAPVILPLLADRPLVLKRTPDGISGEMFFQQNAPEQLPEGVRVSNIAQPGHEPQRRFIGGDLITLLYTVQLGCISVDPWMSRIDSLDAADYAIIDLDPGPGANFGRVVQTARWVIDALGELDLHGVVKTSGSRGIHVAVPLPLATSYDTSLAVAQRVALRVVESHPRETTIERSLQNRPHGTVYVDCLQNVRGKSVAGAYAVRARARATVSTPLAPGEVGEALDPASFTIGTVPTRVARTGDLWGPPMRRRNSSRAIRSALASRGAGSRSGNTAR